MFKLFLKHANMQDANFGHTTAATDILKTSTSLINLKKLFQWANIFILFFFHLQERYAKKAFQYFSPSKIMANLIYVLSISARKCISLYHAHSH